MSTILYCLSVLFFIISYVSQHKGGATKTLLRKVYHKATISAISFMTY